MGKIKRALISVSDKRDVGHFASVLSGLGIEILSTGGTAKFLQDAGIAVRQISDYTGSPEILDGRVKTLHPKVFGGILGMCANIKHVAQMLENNILPIDIVVVNLYPFEATIAKEGCTLEDAIENIDIGGPSLLRAAAKNYQDVTVLVDPEDYGFVLAELNEIGKVSLETNFRLAKKAFAHTARYDAVISNYLGAVKAGKKTDDFPETFTFQVKKVQDCRYGENPHQRGALYREENITEPCAADSFQLNGKELSFNNILDLDAALETVKEYDIPAVAIIKHNNPCGVACAPSSLDAYKNARDCDPTSAFGGVVGFNSSVDEGTAEEMAKIFLEAVIAPGFDPKALRIFKDAKKDLRILQAASPRFEYPRNGLDFKKVVGGILVQDRDASPISGLGTDWRVVTKRQPTENEIQAMRFGWRVAKHVKSNAIVLCLEDRTIGIGAGQMSRVDSARLAVMKANGAGLSTEGAIVASDAMLPFMDSLVVCAKAGATALIQPGGSVRDEEVIAAADLNNMAMVFTGTRHFRH